MICFIRLLLLTALVILNGLADQDLHEAVADLKVEVFSPDTIVNRAGFTLRRDETLWGVKVLEMGG
ncbi:MAG: hypothetical protein Q7U88_10810 [Desulfocapsaceae bacterium]|nr:hypothetical protein [Desulfocapsaceae bacterium]